MKKTITQIHRTNPSPEKPAGAENPRFIPQKCRNLWVLAAACSFFGCVATTTDVDRLQDSLNVVQKGQADLIVQIDELDQTLTVLNERLAESNRKMGGLSQKLDDTQARLGGRMESISQLLSAATSQAGVPVPGDLYRIAYADYAAGKTDLAIGGFKIFLDRYPESELADNAQFYLADCYLSKKEYSKARVEFDKVLGRSRELRPAALLKRAAALKGSRKFKDQELTLETVIKEFPNSNEAQTAKQMLDSVEKKLKPAPSPRHKSRPIPRKNKP